jgi:hypothetical protein
MCWEESDDIVEKTMTGDLWDLTLGLDIARHQLRELCGLEFLPMQDKSVNPNDHHSPLSSNILYITELKLQK